MTKKNPLVYVLIFLFSLLQPFTIKNTLYLFTSGFIISTSHKVNAQSAYDLLNSAYQKFDQGNFKGAILDSTKAIEIKPTFVDAYMLRANAYFQNPKGNSRKNFKFAIDDYSKVIQYAPYFSDAYFNRGLAKSFLKKDKEAILDFTRAIEINSTYADAYHMRGYSKANINDDEGACIDFRKSDSMGYQMLDNKSLKRWIQKKCY